MLLNLKRTVQNNCIHKIYTLMVFVLSLFIAGVFILVYKKRYNYLFETSSNPYFNVMVGCGLNMNG